MKIIVISQQSQLEIEPYQVVKMFDLGLQTFHLRKPKFSTNQLKKYIDLIPKKYHNRIVIHSHHKLALKYPLKGVHITKVHKKRPIRTKFTLFRLKLKNKHISVSTSANKFSTLIEGSDSYYYDYVLLSPIFDSHSNKYHSGFTEQTLKNNIPKSQFDIIARGGIDINTIDKVNELGFRGAALYTGLWKQPDPVLYFSQIINKCRELGIKIE